MTGGADHSDLGSSLSVFAPTCLPFSDAPPPVSANPRLNAWRTVKQRRASANHNDPSQPHRSQLLSQLQRPITTPSQPITQPITQPIPANYTANYTANHSQLHSQP
eukprot:7299874-Pyramimonas_sp.AAC.1